MTRRSDEDWQQLLKAFESSGLSQTAFCKQYRICSKGFVRQKKRLKNESSAPSAFITAKPPSAPVSEVKVSYGKAILHLPLSPLEPTLALLKGLA